MAIIEQILSENTDLIKRYSDRYMMIRQIETGEMYGEAIDLITSPWTYEETDIPIEGEEEITDEEAIDILFGGEY